MSTSPDRDPAEPPARDPDQPTETKAGLLDELLAIDERGATIATARTAAAGPSTRVGRFVTWAVGEAPTVDYPGNERGPLSARSIIALDPADVAAAIDDGRGVLLTFEDGRPEAPIITGLLHGNTRPPEPEPEPEPEQVEAELPETGELEARLDGRRVELEAADEIVLRCGEASIVLRRNGRVIIRGTYVETRSRGVNRIKGGSVEIN